MDKKVISAHIEWYIGNVLVYAQFSSKLAHGTCTLSVCFIMQLHVFKNLLLKIFSCLYKLKRCSNKECCKQCRYVKFKGTMTK